MVWFQRLFPVLMMAWPAAVVLWLLARRTPRETDRHQARVLLTATAVLLAVHGLVQLGLEWSRPAGSPLRVAWPVLIAVLGSLVLWFGFALRLLVPASPARVARRDDGSVRTASLAPRHRQNPVPRAAWTLGWLVFVGCVAVTLVAIARGAPAGLLAGVSFWLFSGPLAARLSLTEAEPLDPEGSEALRRAYAGMRRFKAWTFYGVGLSGTMVFALVAGVVSVRPDAGAVLGSVLGTTVGLAGAVLGTIGGIRRARLIELRQQLIAARPESSGA